MNLLSLKRELEQLKALARARCGSGCLCEYVEVIDRQKTTKEQEEILGRNRECYDRHIERNLHVGFCYITVPSNSIDPEKCHSTTECKSHNRQKQGRSRGCK